MSNRALEEGYNPFRDITTLDLTDDQKEMVLEYLAHKYWSLQQELGIRDGHCKSYDPLVIDGRTAHTYVFDLEDGGRHHSFKDYAHLEKMLDAELLATIKGEINDIDVETPKL